MSNDSIESTLGYLILKAKVPKYLNKISFSDIVRIRNDYDDLKKAFHNSVRKIVKDNEIDKIIDVKVVKDKLEDVAKDFIDEYDRFNSYSGRFMRTIKDWRVQTIGLSLGAIAKGLASKDPASLSFGLSGITISILGKIPIGKKNIKNQSFHYLQVLNKEIDPIQTIKNMEKFIYPIRGLA